MSKMPTAAAPVNAALTLVLKGDVHTVVYEVTRFAPAPADGTAGVRLEKQAGRGEVYEVVRTRLGTVECSCPSYANTFAGTFGMCKHGRALVAVGLLDAPAVPPPVPTDPRPPVERTDDEPGDGTAADDAPAAPVVTLAERRAARTLAERRADLAAVVEGLYGLPTIAEVASAAGVSRDMARRAILARFTGEVVGAIADLAVVAPASPGFADELHEAIGTPPIDPPAEREAATPAPVAAPAPETPREPAPTMPGGRRPFGFGILDDEDDAPEGTWNAADRRPRFAPLPSPVKPPALPPGRYDLAGLVTGQAAMLRGQGSAPFALMADTLDELARSIRHTGAKSVVDYLDRKAEMEGGWIADIEARGYQHGWEAAMVAVA